MERFTRDAAQAVERRAFDKTDAEIRQQGRDVPGVRPVALLAIQLLPEIEKRNWSDSLRELRRVVDDLEHFRQVLLESGRGIFCEPFWRQTFRAEPKGGFSCH